MQVTYTDVERPVLTIEEALEVEGRSSRLDMEEVVEGEVEKEEEEGMTKVQGEFAIGGQLHLHLEPHTALARPNEEGGLDMVVSTQHMDAVQAAVAATLGLKEHTVNLQVRRLGGAFGGKLSNSKIAATACAVAAHRLGAPVRLVTDLRTTLEAAGKRLPYLVSYTAAMDAQGKLASVAIKLTCDSGSSYNESTADIAVMFARSVYASRAWRLTPTAVLTDTPSNTYCRAPGSPQGHAAMETVMEHLATVAGTDPLLLREANMVESADLQEVLARLKESSDYTARAAEVQEHNLAHRWTKRGLALVPLQYPHSQFGTRYSVDLAVYHGDGSLAVTHGGVEMGQGINTKVVQVVARELAVPMEAIKVKPTNSFNNANNSFTAGSMGSEGTCAAAIHACRDLRAKMAVVVEEGEEVAWGELVRRCYGRGVDLTGHHMGHSIADNLANYTVMGAAVTEVVVDVLTGQHRVVRCDFIEDTGGSLRRHLARCAHLAPGGRGPGGGGPGDGPGPLDLGAGGGGGGEVAR